MITCLASYLAVQNEIRLAAGGCRLSANLGRRQLDARPFVRHRFGQRVCVSLIQSQSASILVLFYAQRTAALSRNIECFRLRHRQGRESMHSINSSNVIAT
jgi:hypothetical protein